MPSFESLPPFTPGAPRPFVARPLAALGIAVAASFVVAACGGGSDGGAMMDASAPPDAGPMPDGGVCMTPKDCADYGFVCGVFDDGCGKPLDCTMFCDGGGGGGGGTDAAPPPSDAGCSGPMTCAELGYKCGVFNVCGTDIDCTAYCGDAGGGGGGPIDAGPGPTDAGCTGPTTCAELGFKCGVFNVCGIDIDCNAYCGDAGVPAPDGGGACGTMKSCADYPGVCGIVPDGCGGQIFCDNNGDPNCVKQ